MLRLSQNLLLGLLFLLQGIAPLVHAHVGAPGVPQGIHVDGLGEALRDTGDTHSSTRAREDESPGIGIGTAKRNDERAMPPAGVAIVPPGRSADASRIPAPALPRASSVAHPPDTLRPAPRAPPTLRLS